MTYRSRLYPVLFVFALLSYIGCGQNSSKDNKTLPFEQGAATFPALRSAGESNLSSTDDKCDFSKFAPLRGSFDPRPDDSIEKPSYPDLAKRSGIQGTIIVRALVGLDGKIIKACALDGPALLQEASEKAALKSSFAPALLNGKPRYVERTMVFRFVLKQ